MIFEVSYTVKCKPGIFSSNEFYFKYPICQQSWDDVYDDIFGFLNNFPWKRLQFVEYTEPDIRLVNDQPSNSDIIRTNQEFERKFLPEARRLHDKNGTLQRNNNNRGGSGGGGIPLGVKAAGSFYAGYKIGKSNLTG